MERLGMLMLVIWFVFVLLNVASVWQARTVRERSETICIQAQKSARFAHLIFSYLTSPSEGRRWYPRKQFHSSRYRIGGSPLSSQIRWSNRRGVKYVLSLWCLPVLLPAAVWVVSRSTGSAGFVLV